MSSDPLSSLAPEATKELERIAQNIISIVAVGIEWGSSPDLDRAAIVDELRKACSLQLAAERKTLEKWLHHADGCSPQERSETAPRTPEGDAMTKVPDDDDVCLHWEVVTKQLFNPFTPNEWAIIHDALRCDLMDAQDEGQCRKAEAIQRVLDKVKAFTS